MSDFSIKKPISVWNKPLEADFKSLFRSITKTAISGAALDFTKAGKEAADAISSIGLESKPGEVAWLLIYRALTRALHLLVLEQRHALPLMNDATRAEQNLEVFQALDEVEMHIYGSLFEDPVGLPLLKTLGVTFQTWLIGAGLPEARSAAVAGRLPRYFVGQLAEEWWTRAETYSVLQSAMQNPFAEPAKEEFQWQRYAAWLQQQVDEPVFEESFSLRQIYIPVRGFWVERGKNRHQRSGKDPESKNHVVDLGETFETWLNGSDSNDAIRVLSGGPGSGKSSIAKVLAARAASEGRRVVLVPLQYFDAREDLIEVLASPEFRDLPPTQVVPKLADEGRYLASESTMYRILHEAGQAGHRESSRSRTHRRPRERVATGPNQVWSWDISYLRSPIRGAFYYLYLFMDVWSRKIVGAGVFEEECNKKASKLFRKICRAHRVNPRRLVLHSDNGGPMTGSTMRATLESLGVVPSLSRPRVSDDNPFSESLFRTLKYRPSYPDGPFESLEAARRWVALFTDWYNEEHFHSAIGWVTPAARHSGRDQKILKNRRNLYLQAQKRHPERFASGIRQWRRPEIVRLNPERRKENQDLASAA